VDPRHLASNKPVNEPLDPTGPNSATVVSGRKVVAAAGVAFAVMFAAMALARLYLPPYVAAQRRAIEQGCGERLRAVGAAARAYAADHRSFPHVRGRTELDGGIETQDSPKAFRSLIASGHLQDPTDLICPSMPRKGVKGDARRLQEKWLSSGEGDAHVLAISVVVGYGWTRRALDSNAGGSLLLAADRAAVPRRGPEGVKGNHTRGWNVLSVDGAVNFRAWNDDPFPGLTLSATKDSQADGYLALREQRDPSVFDPSAR
jgi:hypothetical protein